MRETLITPFMRSILACVALFGVSVVSLDASAQMNPAAPPPPPGAAVNPMCQRLEAQLATIDHGGGGDPAKDEQIRRYQDAAAKQQAGQANQQRTTPSSNAGGSSGDNAAP